MKKLLIVNNNMQVGGVQKSLYNLLWNIRGSYDITLYLFHNAGEYSGKLPPEVNVIEDCSLFTWLGRSQSECRGLGQRLLRGALAAPTRIFGRHSVMRLFLLSKKTLREDYDCAIAFLHNGNPRNFYGGVQEFVYYRTCAKKKIAFLHCDYTTCGANHKHNNRLLEKFDAIAACSEGCRNALLTVLPHLKDRCAVVHNCHHFSEIRSMAAHAPVTYEPDYVHILMVCRMTHEKGVERAICAVRTALEQGHRVKLHLVGNGAMLEQLKAMCREPALAAAVTFYGEKANPYAYMSNADLLLIASYYEAAPMVIEEAACLGLPTLTVRTVSAHEMVERKSCGWVCQNTQQALEQELLSLLSDRTLLKNAKKRLLAVPVDNGAALEEFHHLTES